MGFFIEFKFGHNSWITIDFEIPFFAISKIASKHSKKISKYIKMSLILFQNWDLPWTIYLDSFFSKIFVKLDLPRNYPIKVPYFNNKKVFSLYVVPTLIIEIDAKKVTGQKLTILTQSSWYTSSSTNSWVGHFDKISQYYWIKLWIFIRGLLLGQQPFFAAVFS